MLNRGVLLKPMLQLAAGRALGFALTFMIPVVLVRVLDQSAFGTYKQLFLVYATLYGIAPLGMAECLYYFLPLEPERAGRFIANSVVALLGSGLVVFLALTFGAPLLANALANPAIAQHATLLGVFVALTMTSAVTEIVMITRNRHRLSAIVYTMSDASRAACLVVPALLWRDLHAVMWGAALFSTLRVAAMFVYLRAEFRRELRIELPLLRAQLGYALPFAVAVTLEIAQGNLHQFVVAHLCSTATFALYSVGCLQIPLVDFVATGAGSVLMVKLGEHSAASEHEARLELWHEAVRKLALLLFPLVALLLVAGRELIVCLFTARFSASVPVFWIASLAIALAAFPTDSALRSFGQTRFLMGMNLLRLVLVAGSIQPLLAALGLPGAALSAVLGTLAAKIVALYRIRRLLEVPSARLLPWRDLATTLGASGAAASAAWLAKNALAAPPFAGMTVAGVVFTAGYAGCAAVLGLIDGRAPQARAV